MNRTHFNSVALDGSASVASAPFQIYQDIVSIFLAPAAGELDLDPERTVLFVPSP